jgi:hypothetical protein
MYGYYPEIRFNIKDNITKEKVPVVRDRIKIFNILRRKLEQNLKEVSEN